jgi:hypothetical protein
MKTLRLTPALKISNFRDPAALSGTQHPRESLPSKRIIPLLLPLLSRFQIEFHSDGTLAVACI